MDTIANHPVTLSVLIAMPLAGIVAKLFGASFARIAKWYLYLAVFAVVIVMNSIFFPFIGGKDYFFRGAIELALIAFVLSWAFEMGSGEFSTRLKELFRRPLVIAVSAFAFIFELATLFAYDRSAAFWSNFERGEGGFQMLHYYLFFFLLAWFFRHEDDWKNLFRFSLVAAGLMILYGVLGNFMVSGFIGPYVSMPNPPATWLHKLVDGRFQGSLGNPAYVAPYLMFAMFYAGYLWVKGHAAANKRALRNSLYGILVAVLLFFFMLSQTRGAFLGLGAGVLVLLLYFIFAGRGTFRKWSLIALVIIFALSAAAFAFKDTAFVQSWPGARLLKISTSDTTAQTRFWTWGSAWKGFLDRPILGWGPENFTAAFDKHFDPRHFVPGQSSETWFDRAHSVFFDYLSETGILGLLGYLSMFVVMAWEFFFRKHPADHERGTHAIVLERGLVFALPVAYLVQGVAIFDVLPMYLNLFLFLGFMTYYFYEKHGQNR